MLNKKNYHNSIKDYINEFPIQFLNTYKTNNNKKIKEHTEQFFKHENSDLSFYIFRHMFEHFKLGFEHYKDDENNKYDINSLRNDLNQYINIKSFNYWIKKFDNKIKDIKILNIADYDLEYFNLITSKQFFLNTLSNIIYHLIKDLYVRVDHNNLLINDNNNVINDCLICFEKNNIYKCKICNTFVCYSCLITNYLHEIIKINENIDDIKIIKLNCTICKNQYIYKNKNNITYKKNIVIHNEGSYSGDVVNNERNGKGLMYYENGDIYQGDWYNNKKHGPGIMRYKSGKTYYGNWKNNNFSIGYLLEKINYIEFTKSYNIQWENHLNKKDKKIYKEYFLKKDKNLLIENYVNNENINKNNLNLNSSNDSKKSYELSSLENSLNNNFSNDSKNYEKSDTLDRSWSEDSEKTNTFNLERSWSDDSEKTTTFNLERTWSNESGKTNSSESSQHSDLANMFIDNCNLKNKNDKIYKSHIKFKDKYFQLTPFSRGTKIKKNVLNLAYNKNILLKKKTKIVKKKRNFIN
jgi:hypothetical protein